MSSSGVSPYVVCRRGGGADCGLRPAAGTGRGDKSWAHETALVRRRPGARSRWEMR